MAIQQILGNIDAALNECCDQNCNDINIRKLMLALRQLENQLCDTNHHHHQGQHNSNICIPSEEHNSFLHHNHHKDKEEKNFFCDNFGNILMIGLLIGILVGVLVYIFDRSVSSHRTYC